MTDSTSYDTACEKGIDIFENLRGHACFEALDAIGDAVFTGNTGTNLCDFNIMYVPELPAKKLKGSRIKKVHARQIIDCKCRPMVEVDVITEDGVTGRIAITQPAGDWQWYINGEPELEYFELVPYAG